MLRIASILTLTFYLTLSIGLHVDIDTCCKSIAGFSLITEEEEHHQEIACCAAKMDACCSTDHDENKKSCPSDCIYIQVLSDQQQMSSPLELKLIPIESINNIGYGDEADSEEDSVALLTYEEPPLHHDQELFMLYASFVTYG